MRGMAEKLMQERRRRSCCWWRSLSSSSSSSSSAPEFGIAFDIDGVLLRGDSPIGGSPRALFLFIWNPCFTISGFAWTFSFQTTLPSNECVVAVGKGEPAAVLSDYGFKDVISIDDYALCFDHIDPLAPYKNWIVDRNSPQDTRFLSIEQRNYVSSRRVQAVFIVSDPVDWSRDIQVLCDILRTGGLPGGEIRSQPHLYFAHDDLKYQGVFPTERFGMGAFRISLQSVFNSIHPHPLQYSALGKPNPLAFKNAEMTLREVCKREFGDQALGGYSPFKTLYMIGDNPSVDIKGAQQAGHPWFSILTKTGVFRGRGYDEEFQADMVVETVEEAVDYILEKENVD